MVNKFKNRYTIDDVKRYCIENGFECLSNEYKTNRGKLEFKCSKDHVFWNTWNHIHTRKQRCPECYGNKLLTYDFVKREFEKENYILHSNKYDSCMEILQVECPNGHQYETSWNNFQQGFRCQNCAGTVRTYDEVKTHIESFSYILNSPEYKNKRTHLDLICPIGHNIKMSWDSFLTGNRCPDCNPQRSKDVVYVQKRLDIINPGQTVIQKIKMTDGRSSKFEVLCQNDHKYLYRPSNTRIRGCPECQTVLAEKQIAEFITGCGFQVQMHNRSIVPNREIDIYIPELKIGIEHNGLYWHSEAIINENYHIEKLNLANKAGIRLINIFEDEWINKNLQTKNFLETILDVGTKLKFEEFKITEINKKLADKLVKSYHLLGIDKYSNEYFGIVYKGECIGVIGVNIGRDIFINRICGIISINTNNWLEKITIYLHDKFKPENIIIYADLRLSDEQEYINAGYYKESICPPVVYCEIGKKTLKVYDCGKAVYVSPCKKFMRC